ncbi:meiosis specific coiled-coil protein Mcp7 [Schizosaccharomyces pombe]|uniref:Meiotic coiled-coil protein 7 n=1 Tax=Schizosaccharomyces pombe (strain 972 / ATCC 24843) TaxID=284812 RepID=MCP7_SCHPO|nr:protein Mcp7 [Schizosaccharomyces pombe]Q09739.1 RecName: Full=Meiotic coiled-coil protein 7; AltName: Full=Meiotically up-regulated gene 32 protein [Schizosaccharomyces pombe 972h-]BAD42847.1 meiotic coiled-coil protein 7 [Schizosaccharomyces pombe]CAA90804.1 meiosis specific coiled-coil protein Mcp7 [Schizosaccharomyces pombe]|eukprot:NP_592991.1 protein Mcp7 [Schizosaccharomyces pombe]
MPPKGLSLAEKRRRLEAIFHDSKDFFQLKEVEKLGSKKQIVLQTVKDVLQSLVDDNIVKTEKIGTSNYYWSFPSDAKRSRESVLGSLQAQLDDLKQKSKTLDENISFEKSKRDNEGTENDANQYTLELLHAKESELKLLKTQLSNLNHCNPETFELKNENTKKYMEAANLWTDQIHTLIAFCRDMGADTNQIREYCSIPEDLDDLQLPIL